MMAVIHPDSFVPVQNLDRVEITVQQQLTRGKRLVALATERSMKLAFFEGTANGRLTILDKGFCTFVLVGLITGLFGV